MPSARDKPPIGDTPRNAVHPVSAQFAPLAQCLTRVLQGRSMDFSIIGRSRKIRLWVNRTAAGLKSCRRCFRYGPCVCETCWIGTPERMEQEYRRHRRVAEREIEGERERGDKSFGSLAGKTRRGCTISRFRARHRFITESRAALRKTSILASSARQWRALSGLSQCYFAL